MLFVTFEYWAYFMEIISLHKYSTPPCTLPFGKQVLICTVLYGTITNGKWRYCINLT